MNTNLRDRVRKTQRGGGLLLAGESLGEHGERHSAINNDSNTSDASDASNDRKAVKAADIINNVRMRGRVRGSPLVRGVSMNPLRPGGFGSFKNWADAYEAAEAGNYAPAASEILPYIGEVMMGLL
jgi:hypothetical protein